MSRRNTVEYESYAFYFTYLAPCSLASCITSTNGSGAHHNTYCTMTVRIYDKGVKGQWSYVYCNFSMSMAKLFYGFRVCKHHPVETLAYFKHLLCPESQTYLLNLLLFPYEIKSNVVGRHSIIVPHCHADHIWCRHCCQLRMLVDSPSQDFTDPEYSAAFAARRTFESRCNLLASWHGPNLPDFRAGGGTMCSFQHGLPILQPTGRNSGTDQETYLVACQYSNHSVQYIRM